MDTHTSSATGAMTSLATAKPRSTVAKRGLALAESRASGVDNDRGPAGSIRPFLRRSNRSTVPMPQSTYQREQAEILKASNARSRGRASAARSPPPKTGLEIDSATPLKANESESSFDCEKQTDTSGLSFDALSFISSDDEMESTPRQISDIPKASLSPSLSFDTFRHGNVHGQQTDTRLVLDYKESVASAELRALHANVARLREEGRRLEFENERATHELIAQQSERLQGMKREQSLESHRRSGSLDTHEQPIGESDEFTALLSKPSFSDPRFFGVRVKKIADAFACKSMKGRISSDLGTSSANWHTSSRPYEELVLLAHAWKSIKQSVKRTQMVVKMQARYAVMIKSTKFAQLRYFMKAEKQAKLLLHIAHLSKENEEMRSEMKDVQILEGKCESHVAVLEELLEEFPLILSLMETYKSETNRIFSRHLDLERLYRNTLEKCQHIVSDSIDYEHKVVELNALRQEYARLERTKRNVITECSGLYDENIRLHQGIRDLNKSMSEEVSALTQDIASMDLRQEIATPPIGVFHIDSTTERNQMLIDELERERAHNKTVSAEAHALRDELEDARRKNTLLEEALEREKILCKSMTDESASLRMRVAHYDGIHRHEVDSLKGEMEIRSTRGDHMCLLGAFIGLNNLHDSEQLHPRDDLLHNYSYEAVCEFPPPTVTPSVSMFAEQSFTSIEHIQVQSVTIIEPIQAENRRAGSTEFEPSHQLGAASAEFDSAQVVAERNRVFVASLTRSVAPDPDSW